MFVKGLPLREAIGRKIVCDDGIGRDVVDIVFSYRYKHCAIINETDPDAQMGHFVNLLSLSCQILGKSIPPKDQLMAFEKMSKALEWQQDEKKPTLTKSGLILPN